MLDRGSQTGHTQVITLPMLEQFGNISVVMQQGAESTEVNGKHDCKVVRNCVKYAYLSHTKKLLQPIGGNETHLNIFHFGITFHGCFQLGHCVWYKIGFHTAPCKTIVRVSHSPLR